MTLRQNEELISVPAGRFAAAATLSHRAELPGGIRGAAQS